MPLSFAAAVVRPDINRADIAQININAQAGQMEVQYTRAHDDGQGTVTPIDSQSVTYTGSAFVALATTATLDGETIYDAIKRVLYARLQADGKLPAGSVE